ncbi:NUDIX hydrolase [Clostridium sp. Marseille-QA1073]
MKIEFYEIGKIDDEELTFAVISTIYQGRWVYVRHKERKSWEIPGGHREIGETIDNTAKRELFEETGAKEFTLKPVCDYSINDFNGKLFGRLFFCEVSEMGILPISEIEEVKLFDELPNDLTYPKIQPYLYEKILTVKCII